MEGFKIEDSDVNKTALPKSRLLLVLKTVANIFIIFAVIFIISLFVFSGLFGELRFMFSRNEILYTSCLESLQGVNSAEKWYFDDHKKYTTNKRHLEIYYTALCTNPDGCSDLVDTRVKSQCAKDFDWDISVQTLGATQSVYIKGVARDKYNCKICVTQNGYFPSEYEDCKGQSSWTCP